ncbi:membrane protein [Microbacterium sp. CH12i]|uniref:alpha/beta hydrolase family protein n=1 Tax=Microbacterium sp. CH12i TaxID=1479651 RepID=UPI000461EB7B|nr:alpha/beta hydrolase [Microbacterium sp. CH12i]KDA05730.1 membrane protein [Microbacterium sp. CH12i]
MKIGLLRRNAFWLALSLVLCLVSAVGASIVQTAAGTVTVKDLQWETSSGRTLNALLFVPDSATADNPAPAVVVSHGWWNNREMQDANYVELTRRGFVVLSIDMYGHGNSDPLPADELEVGGTGLYDGVKLIADLPYVDTSRIGVSGHSNGARAANFSIVIDNEADKPLIAAVFLVDNEAMYTDADGAYANLYGTRDVGLVADQYDEFFFRSYDAEGNVLTPPREFATTPNAQSFLKFGTDPADGETRDVDTVYTESIDGEDAIRILHTPAQTHPWGTISKYTVADQVEFFDTTLGAPNSFEATSQVWQIKEFFTALGLIGFGIFLVAFTRALLFTRAFAGLRTTGLAAAQPVGRRGQAWFWGGLIVSTVISAWSYVWLSQQPWLNGIVFNAVPNIVPTGSVYFIAVWAAINGVAAIIIMALSYYLFGKKNGVRLREMGIFPGWMKLLQSAGLALVVTIAAFGLVFVADYFFKTDFRLWVIALKWFPQDKIWYAFFVLPLFLVYFVANSIALNVFNRFTLGGKEWLNTAALALFNALGPIVLVIAQYVTFASSGHLIPGFAGIASIWLFPVVVILAVTAIISRKIYRETNNPYIAGFINAAVVAMMAVSNSLVITY